jgi:hypothetical protein
MNYDYDKLQKDTIASIANEINARMVKELEGMVMDNIIGNTTTTTHTDKTDYMHFKLWIQLYSHDFGETNFHNIVLARSDFQHNLFTTSNSALFGIIKYIKDSISKDLDNYILVNIDINTGELDLLSTISIREFFSD